MEGLRWSWLAAPYVACATAVAAVGIAAALIRGDRVTRLGVISASVTTLPWAVCQGLAAMANDAPTAMRLLKLGQGPVSLVGPNLLLVLLAVSGQLERFRRLARLAPVIGIVFLVLTWSTSWIVPDVRLLSSGMYYISPGPLTGAHLSQLIVWLAIGLGIMRRSSPRGERRRTQKLAAGVLVFAALGSVDTLLLYGVWGSYPIAWLPALIAACIALYMVLTTDVLRPRGFDRGAGLELGAFMLAIAATIPIAMWLADSPVTLVAIACLAWAALTGVAWGIERARPARVAEGRALGEFVARVATLDDVAAIVNQLAMLWKTTIGIEIKHTVLRDELNLEPDVATWLVRHAEPVAVADLATMRLGDLRPKLERLRDGNAAGLIVPLIDRGELVGLVEADYELALRDAERALIAESGRAVARAFTFVGLAHAAARERETAREVEVADALRLQASASRDAELGHWAVAAEYRTAPRTTGAGWSAIELADGRLALLATEAQAHGVAAALATAALTGAFAAATTPGIAPVTLDELLATMQASSEGVMRGGEPVAAFLAILDGTNHTIDWACAGHPGAFVIEPASEATRLGGSEPGGSLTVATRGALPLPAGALLVVASTALRGSDEAWVQELRDSAPVGGRLATVLVERSLAARDPSADLLAVVVRSRHTSS